MLTDLILMTLYMCCLGAAIGTVSGIIPGIHVNTLAAIMLASYPLLQNIFSSFVPEAYIPVMLACCILSASVVHSSVDFVPSVFIGVPDVDSVLNVLPGHRMLLDGEGMTAVRCAAIGSIVGAFTSIIMAVPMYYLLSNGLGNYLDSITIGFLFIVLALMILKENGMKKLVAILILTISGLWGLFCMQYPIPLDNLLGMEPEIMLPLLSGLFGIPALITSNENGDVPPQTDDETYPVGPVPGLKGVITGSVTGWFPGVTSTTGASLANVIFGKEDIRGFISMISSIGTAATMFAFVTYAVSGKTRTGTMIAIDNMIGNVSVTPNGELFWIMMIAMAIASVFAYFITIGSGKVICRFISEINVTRLNKCILVLIISITFVMTGYWGLVILALSTLIGMIPVMTGTNRAHLTGCLIIPVLIFKIGLM